MLNILKDFEQALINEFSPLIFKCDGYYDDNYYIINYYLPFYFSNKTDLNFKESYGFKFKCDEFKIKNNISILYPIKCVNLVTKEDFEVKSANDWENHLETIIIWYNDFKDVINPINKNILNDFQDALNKCLTGLNFKTKIGFKKNKCYIIYYPPFYFEKNKSVDSFFIKIKCSKKQIKNKKLPNYPFECYSFINKEYILIKSKEDWIKNLNKIIIWYEKYKNLKI